MISYVESSAVPLANDVIIRIVVHGTPAPAGSKRGFPIRKGGRIVGVSVTDANKQAKPWQAAIRAEAAERMNGAELLRGPLQVGFRFVVARPKGHYGKRGLRPSAPEYPAKRPDVLKLARPVEDALSGIVYQDDSQIVIERLVKEYGSPERVEITINALSETVSHMRSPRSEQVREVSPVCESEVSGVVRRASS